MVDFCVLVGLAIVGSVNFGGTIVPLLWNMMFKFFECLYDVAIHTHPYCSFVVIPFGVHSESASVEHKYMVDMLPVH